MKHRAELLAPAGGYDSVEAAVRCGADAVYIGGEKFSARASAKNFTYDEMKKAVEYCHQNGAAVHRTMNTIIFDREADDFANEVARSAECGIDALIIEDLGAAEIAKQVCPEMPLHASTQMSIHNIEGVRAAEKLGFSRVVLARELSLEEIKNISSQTDIELEVFVHGALCMCVSGQCYFSAVLGSRSGNRGMCAQPCRLPFKAGARDYALSLKDLCAADYIERLIEAGVDSFKIEGRMKRPEYVAAAVRTYSDILMRKPYETDTLKAVFSRSGFTNSYLTAGRSDMFGIRSKNDVAAANNKLLAEIRNSYRKPLAKIALKMKFTARVQNPCVLQITDEDGNFVEVSGAAAEKAVNLPLDENRSRASLEKLGGTPFYLAEFAADIENGISVSLSDINAMRREACGKLLDLRAKINKFALFKRNKTSAGKYIGPKEIIARVENIHQLYKSEKADKFVVPLCIDFEKIGNINKDRIILELPRVSFDTDAVKEQIKKLAEQGYKTLCCSTLGDFELAFECGFKPFGGFSMNIVNSESIKTAKRLGAEAVVFSPEITLSDIEHIGSEIDTGIFAYGKLPLMVTRNCPLKETVGCRTCMKNGAIKDRKGIEFKVFCRSGYTEILNSRPVFMADRLNEIKNTKYLFLYFTDETPEQTEQVIDMYKNGGSMNGGYTRGLLYRGVL